MRTRLLVTVAIALAVSNVGRPARPQAAEAVQWTDLVNAAVVNGVLRATGCAGCPAGGRSAQTIGGGGGHVEFTPAVGAPLVVGLSTQLSASTDYSQVEYAFRFWPDGGFDVRERGSYRAEGQVTAGDRFKVAVEAGVVKYYRNSTLVYTSSAAPAYPLVLDATLLSASATVSGAVAVVTGSVPVPAPGGYEAITDRVTRVKPGTAAPASAGGRYVDPAFGSQILRVTDANTRPGSPSLSYRSPSGSHQNAWNTTGRYFYVVSTDGALIPYAFDRASMTASRIAPTGSGDGGLVLRFSGEPQFSFFDETIIFGVYHWAGSNLRTIVAYDFARNVYTPLLDLDTVVPGLSGTYVGGMSVSAGPVEKVNAFFGGPSQGHHRYAIVFERRNPSVRRVVDTLASTVDGLPTNIPLNFRLHHAFMDKSGQYVMLYPPSMDQQPPRRASPTYVWNLASNTFTELPLAAARMSGHDGIGYGYLTNQDCCTRSSWDAAQWQIRSLAAPFVIADLIAPVLTPKEVLLADHQSWPHAEEGRLVPIISATYRVGLTPAPWRAWDDEIIAVQTDRALLGGGATVWRFAHHRSNVANDNDSTSISFWYTPRAIASQDGRWAIFTSNWDKSLGIDPRGQSGGVYRQDVFAVQLRMAGEPVAGGPRPPRALRVVSP